MTDASGSLAARIGAVGEGAAPVARPLSAVLAYGALGAPLAFVALPLYVQWPAHHAATHGVPLAALGAVLLGVRVADAVVDPWIGRLADRWFSRDAAFEGGRRAGLAWWVCGAAALAVSLGFVALFFPPAGLGIAGLLAWGAAALAVTSFGFSFAQVLHQAWGARLGGGAAEQARVVGAREAQSLIGVLAASAMPALFGFGITATVLALWLALAWWALGRGPQPTAMPEAQAFAPGPAGGAPAAESASNRSSAPASDPPPTLWQPLRTPAFRRLLMLHLLNGLASAIPATLVLFFIRDRLQQPAAEAPLLALYFACAALAVPLWVRAVRRWGLRRTWAAGMLTSVAAFVWAAGLGSGDVWGFALVCAASGAALGADLTVPPALLAGVIAEQGEARRSEGGYFGWWNFAGKASLALAAGLALPLVQALGYQPGATDAASLTALAWTYAGLPCLLKLAALALLWHSRALWRAADGTALASTSAPAPAAAHPPV
jgi:glycoside/pentoside/hexuronide:cation symporter, GPH family